jgi:outer membrane protein OmpA-like peptidoglycan-associated protein
MTTGPDGSCMPPKNSRGFSLGGAGKAAAAAPRPATPAKAAPVGARQATAPRPGRTAAAAPAYSVGKGDLLINFRLGSAELTEQARSNAKVFAQGLQRDELKGARFEIAGHTDSTGGPDANQALSQARAESVKSFLVSQGVSASRLDAKGYGYSQLALPNSPTSSENRRVEAKRLN